MGNIYLQIFTLGCAMLVLGIAGMAHVSRSRSRRRHMVVFTLDELLGSSMRAQRRREVRIELVSRSSIMLGGVLALAAYFSW
ncbi:MAG TPA: hypothetical protein VJ806_14340 [Luteimonas sp.]|nr:hypothetical protein [Luteimonas sp.]